MSEDHPHIYEFGDFHLDSARRVLLRCDDDQPVKLTSKAFDTLLYMVRHGGAVLDKEELMRAVWPDTFVEENNLSQNVSALRRALGEKQGENRYIATVPGRGFSFVAEVRAGRGKDGRESTDPVRTENNIERQEMLQGVDLTRPDQHKVGRRGKLWPAVFGGIIVAALGAGALHLWRLQKATGPAQPIRTIAVLPFKPLVVENRDEALELGMADTLIARLSHSREVIVRPLSSVRRYGGLEQDPQAAGRELGVESVLDGGIQRWGDRIRVTARLINVPDGTSLWVGTFDEKFTGVFAVQDAISGRVADELALRLTGEERELLAKRYTPDPEAYELYLKGRFFVNQLRLESIMKAIGFFEEAIRKDPNYALAYAGIADCYNRLPVTSDVPSREAFPQAKEAALRALEIDGQLAEAHTILGWIKLWYEWNWEGAGREFRRALEINPNYPVARMGYAHLLSDLGRHQEALDEVDRALRLDPLSSFAGTLKGHFLFHARRYPQAIDQLHRTLEIEPNFWVGQITLGKNYERAGRYEEALEAFRKAGEFSGGNSETISLSGFTYAMSGRRGEADRMLRELEAMSEQRYVPPYNVALVYHGLGDSGEALKLLEKAYQERDVHMVFLGVDPKWDALHDNPGFVKIIGRMNLLK